MSDLSIKRSRAQALTHALPLAALVLHWGTAGAVGASAQASFACVGRLEAGAPPGAQESLSATLTARLDDGDLLGVVDEESGRVQRLFYDAEIASGTMTIAGNEPQDVLWTRGRNNGADFIGESISSTGEITAVKISARSEAPGQSAFVLFDTRTKATYRGSCAPS